MSKITIDIGYLDQANQYASMHSTCLKTHVGCCIMTKSGRCYFGANCNPKENCKKIGCLRQEVFGDNSKEHRATCRCYANHSEVDALNKCAGDKPFMAWVTRYPCFECATALVNAGIKRVVYGREFPIDKETQKLFEENDVQVIHMNMWNCDVKDTNN